MNVYISADIEGVAGICHWDEATRSKPDYEPFRRQMQREVEAACRAALAAGATSILVNDAHESGRNLDPAAFPLPVRVLREWSEHPFMMVQELDAAFDALAMIGYHAGAGSAGNPLAHTFSLQFSEVRINDQRVAEFHINAWTAALVGVPTVFVSGDAELCCEVEAFAPGIRTVATGEGRGRSVVANHPDRVTDAIESELRAALADPPSPPALPGFFRVEIDYRDAARAYRASFYPGARLEGSRTWVLETEAWMDVIRALVFI